VVLGAGAATAVTGTVAGLIAGWMAPRPGLDPLQPVAAAHQGLFGPRSVRVAAAVIALIAASWVSFNVPLGSVAAGQGALFPVAFIFTCGVLRIFLARTVTDLSVGVVAIGLAVSVGWLLRAGSGPLPDAAGVIAIVPVAGAVEGWLAARRRPPASAARP
jgi:ribose/xylose/arabinose/galactoside ABC-type transport system permease subunit